MGIASVMNDPEDEHQFVVYPIENAMPTVHQAPHAFPELGSLCTGEWPLPQPGECILEPPQVSVRYRSAK